MSTPFAAFAEELNNTAVLSDAFKDRLLAFTTVALEDAFRRGVEQGRKQPPHPRTAAHSFTEQYAPGWFRCSCGAEVYYKQREARSTERCPGPLESVKSPEDAFSPTGEAA